jgi:hypothetical protein
VLFAFLFYEDESALPIPIAPSKVLKLMLSWVMLIALVVYFLVLLYPVMLPFIADPELPCFMDTCLLSKDCFMKF